MWFFLTAMQAGNSSIDSTIMTPLILKREEVTPMEVSTNAPASNVFKVSVWNYCFSYQSLHKFKTRC